MRSPVPALSFLRSAGALFRQARLELMLVDGNHDDAESLASARARRPALGPVPLGYRLHHLPAGTRFRIGRLRCLAYGGAFPVPSPRADRDWYRTVARERAALQRLASGGEVDLLFCHDPRTLEQGEQARGTVRRLRREAAPRARLLRSPTPCVRKRRWRARARRARLLQERSLLGGRARQRRDRFARSGALKPALARSRLTTRQSRLVSPAPASTPARPNTTARQVAEVAKGDERVAALLDGALDQAAQVASVAVHVAEDEQTAHSSRAYRALLLTDHKRLRFPSCHRTYETKCYMRLVSCSFRRRVRSPSPATAR